MGFFIKIYDQLHINIFKLKGLLKDLFSFLFVRVYLIIIVAINLFLGYLSYYMYQKISQNIAILHYNVDFGVDLIGNKINFFSIPLLSLIFILVNLIILLSLVKKKDFKFLSYFLLSFLLLFHIFLVLSIIPIYLINF